MMENYEGTPMVATAYKRKDAKTEEDLDNIVDQIKPFLSSSRLVHVKTWIQENKNKINIQYARISGCYKFWIDKRPIGSADLLARYFDLRIKVKQGECRTMT